MGKKFEQYGDSEATDFNMKAIKASKSNKQSEDLETDYSIPGKKRGTYKQDAD